MSGTKRGLKAMRCWIRYVVLVVIQTGTSADYDTYIEEHSGMEWCNKKGALIELNEALEEGHIAFIERREITRI